MKIGILSRNATLYSTRRLIQAAHERGHTTHVINTLSVSVEIGANQNGARPIQIVLPGKMGVPKAIQLPALNAIIPRIGPSATFYGLAVVRQLEQKGLLTTATASAIACSRDKLHSLQLMQEAHLPIPKTAVISERQMLYTAVQSIGGLPIVIKLIRGTQGKGVVLAKNLATAAAVLEKVRKAGKHALIQEFITESAGRDLRLIVVGNRCVAAMERQSADDDFRANIHRGGTGHKLTPSKELQQLAVATAKAHGLGVAGVDLVQSKRGPLLLEINSSPGLGGIEGATGVDVAKEIIMFLEGLE